MTDPLTTEIVRRIFLDIGVTDGPTFGKLGITESCFLLDKKMKIRYDSGDLEHKMYAGQMKLDSSLLRGLLVDLTVDDVVEFGFVFRMDALPIHGMKITYGDDLAYNFIKLYDDEKKSWVNANMYMQAMILANFERITSWGILWDNSKDIDDLYQAIIKMIV